MNDAKHSLLPWYAGKAGGSIVSDGTEPNVDSREYYGGYCVAGSMSAADRDFVIQACNAHEGLVARVLELEQERDTARAEIDAAWAALGGRVEDESLMVGIQAQAYGYEQELGDLRALLGAVAASGVELDDPRIGYVTVQIDRATWDVVRALAPRKGEP